MNKLPSVEFNGKDRKTLRGRSHLPSIYRDLIKVHEDSPKISLELSKRDTGLVLWLVIREKDGVIRDVYEVTPDREKMTKFFKMHNMSYPTEV